MSNYSSNYKKNLKLHENDGDKDNLSEFYVSDLEDKIDKEEERYNDMPNDFSQMMDFYKEQMEYREKLFSENEKFYKSKNQNNILENLQNTNYIQLNSFHNYICFPDNYCYTMGQI